MFNIARHRGLESIDIARGRSLRMSAVLLALFACNWLIAPSARAYTFTARTSGNWNSTATWGLPITVADTDYVSIPAGITVTIPSAMLLNHKGGLRVEGTLIIQGQSSFASTVYVTGALINAARTSFGDINVYGSLTNTGTLFLTGAYSGTGTLLNQGQLFNDGSFFESGTFTNDVNASLENRKSMAMNTIYSVSTNRGTWTNKGSLEFYERLYNYGVLNNESELIFERYGNRNMAGARINNTGSFTLLRTVPVGSLTNEGTINNAGTLFNGGEFVNCTGALIGSGTLSGDKLLGCGAARSVTYPSPEWRMVSAPQGVAMSSVTAASSSRIAGSGSTLLLNGSGTRLDFTYEANTTNKIAMQQTSMGADGTWWGVKADQSIWRMTGSTWTRVPGDLKQVSVGSANNVWGVNSLNYIYQWNGSSWTRIPGELQAVSVASDGTVWGISPGTLRIWKRTGNSWTQMPELYANKIAVGSASNIWIIDTAGKPYKWNGSGWTLMVEVGKCTDLAVAADGTILFVNALNNYTYRSP